MMLRIPGVIDKGGGTLILLRRSSRSGRFEEYRVKGTQRFVEKRFVEGQEDRVIARAGRNQPYRNSPQCRKRIGKQSRCPPHTCTPKTEQSRIAMDLDRKG